MTVKALHSLNIPAKLKADIPSGATVMLWDAIVTQAPRCVWNPVDKIKEESDFPEDHIRRQSDHEGALI